MKGFFKYLIWGVAWGCTWLVLMTVLLSIWSRPAFAAIMADYPWQALGAVAVGVASTVPARIYSLRRLPYIWRFLIHMGIALPVYFAVAFSLNWIPYHPGSLWLTALEILIGVGIFLVIWSVFYLLNRREAKRINARVEELQRMDAQNGR